MNSWGVLLQEGPRALDGALSSLLKLSGTLILPLTDKWANTLFEVFFLFPLLFAFGIGEVLSPTTPGISERYQGAHFLPAAHWALGQPVARGLQVAFSPPRLFTAPSPLCFLLALSDQDKSCW